MAQLTIIGLVTANLEDVHRQGLRHPVLGGFLDAGSYASVAGVAPGPAGLRRIMGAALDRAAGAAGVPVQRTSSLQGGPAAAAAGLRLLREFARLERIARSTLLAWHEELAGAKALSWVVGDEAGRRPPLWLLCGHHLPCMGPIAPCAVEDVWATWLRLAGGASAAGRFLLEEPPSPLDPAAEAGLTERLRQLYGD